MYIYSVLYIILAGSQENHNLIKLRQIRSKNARVVWLHWELPFCLKSNIQGQTVVYQEIDKYRKKLQKKYLITGKYNKNYVIHGLKPHHSYAMSVVVQASGANFISNEIIITTPNF